MEQNQDCHECECGNCDWRGEVSQCDEIHNLLDRVEVGDLFPAGQCPQCGALTYLVENGPKDQQDSDLCVILSVSGGVADVMFKPTGIAVTIFDYDADGVDDPGKDPDGENCIIGTWLSEQEVVGKKHWPIIRQARQNATCRCTRKWQCPSCGNITEHAYEEIVEVGRPYCRHCEIEMMMV